MESPQLSIQVKLCLVSQGDIPMKFKFYIFHMDVTSHMTHSHSSLPGIKQDLKFYTHARTHACNINEKRDQEFEREHGEVYGRVWRQEREERNDIISILK